MYGQRPQKWTISFSHSQWQIVPYIAESSHPCPLFWYVLAMLLLKPRGKKRKLLMMKWSEISNRPWGKRHFLCYINEKLCNDNYNNIRWPKLNYVIITGCVQKLVCSQMCSWNVVLIFGRRKTLRRKLYCWGLGFGRISFNGWWLRALAPLNNFLSCICMISLTFNGTEI